MGYATERTIVNRRRFLKTAGLGCMTALLPKTGLNAAAPAAGTDKPLNVVLIMMDQHHHGVMGCAGNPVIKTPNIDRLAREGVRFTNAVCATPYCSPTRSSLVRGQWPHTTGIIHNCARGKPALTSDDNSTEGDLFSRGYATEFIGKWHLGIESDFECYANVKPVNTRLRASRDRLKATGFKPAPPRKGETLIEKPGIYTTEHNLAAWQAFHDFPASKRKGQDLMAIGRQAIPAQSEPWGEMADDAVAWIKKNRKRPFMITYSAGPPHALWTAPDPWYSMYDPAEVPVPKTLTDSMPAAYVKSGPAQKGKFLGEKGFREMIRCYYAQVTMIDAYIGRILKAIDEAQLADNTLVIYLSDHGDMQGAQGGMLGKSIGAFYDQIVRVPLIMRLPGIIEAGKTVAAHANSVDIRPTIADYAGLTIDRRIQGRSLRPIIEGHEEDEAGYGFCERPGGRMIRSVDWKYCLYCARGRQREELFDLRKDPDEATNRADDSRCADRKRTLRRALIRHMQETHDTDFYKSLHQ